MSPSSRKPKLLVIDTGSPRSSVAVGSARQLLATREFELRQASEQLLDMVAEVLREAKLHFGDLAGIAALQGPGSFTGLRIGLATVLGFHQASKVPATALPTLPALALAARDHMEPAEAESAGKPAKPRRVIAAVDALRGDFYAQTFAVGTEVRTLDAPRLWSRDELAAAGLPLIGAGLSSLGFEVLCLEPPPLAPFALRLLSRAHWDAGRLIQPIYYRPPAVTLAGAVQRPPSAPSEVAAP